MKAKKLITASAAVLLAFGFAGSASAAEVGSTTTEGDVTFSGADEDTEGGNPTAPDNKDDENTEDMTPDTEEGSHTNGSLRLEHVPTLHFGNQVVSTKDMNYNSLWNTGTVGDSTTSTDIPVFVQVRDETAQKTNNWTVSVAQSSYFSPSDDTSTSPDLTNTRVHIYAATAYNSLNSTSSSIASATAVTVPTDGYVEVPYGTSGVTILTGENTNGSESSVVFSDTTQYDPSTGSYAVTGTDNEGLKLFVPGTDVAYAEEYTATFTWTLEDTL